MTRKMRSFKNTFLQNTNWESYGVNQWSGSVHVNLGKCVKLQQLDLSYNTLTGHMLHVRQQWFKSQWMTSLVRYYFWFFVPDACQMTHGNCLQHWWQIGNFFTSHVVCRAKFFQSNAFKFSFLSQWIFLNCFGDEHEILLQPWVIYAYLLAGHKTSCTMYFFFIRVKTSPVKLNML